MSASEPEILFERRGVTGWVTLNRPQSLNALTHRMVLALSAQLERWRDDSEIERVVLTGAGNRAFCAGGDIRALYDLGHAGRHDEALAFWRDEYVLNATIKTYPKPYVSLIDGIVMGGGFGLSVHGSYRVAGDRFMFAMPEVGIGFFPDVGGTWFLPRMPDALGVFCAMTGDRLTAPDAVSSTVATHRVPSSNFGALSETLCAGGEVDQILASYAVAHEATALQQDMPTIARLFEGRTVDEILAALDREAEEGGRSSAFASRAAATIRKRSPTSLKIALRQMLDGPALSFADCMRTEFRIVSRIVHGHDFYEGVRAAIIDKDNALLWRPAHLAEVSEAEIDRHFANLGAEELVLP